MASQQSVLRVSGMTCGGCARGVDRAIREVDGVVEVEVRLGEASAIVKHDPARAPVERLLEAVRAAGYEPALAAS